MSREDLLWLKKVESACEVTGESHYQIPLPFREENVQLPDNLQMASRRLESLKRKLRRRTSSPGLHQLYGRDVEEMLR